MADGKKRRSMTTLGMSMLRFGRKLMRSYETPTSKPVKPSIPYQSMASPSLNWDNVVPSTQSPEPTLPDEAEMPYEEFDPFAQSQFQQQRRPQQGMPQQRPQRPVQQRQQRPAQPPVQRKKSSGIDPRLQRVLDFHKQREMDRESTRQERRRQWEETEGQEQIAPDIPGWKPKKRAAFDYIETSSLTQGADKPSQTSESKSDPVQRKEDDEPERSVRSKITEQYEMSEPDFDDGFIAANEPSFDDFYDEDINLNTDDMDTIPMSPIVPPSSTDTVQRQADIQPSKQDRNDDIQRYSSDTITDEQVDNYSYPPDNKQSNQAHQKPQQPAERPQNRRIQRRAQENPQTSGHSQESRSVESSDSDTDEDTSDSFRVAPTTGESLPIQRTPDTQAVKNQNTPDISDNFAETGNDTSQTKNLSDTPQPAIQRFAEVDDSFSQDDAWNDEGYSNEDYGTDNYQADSISPHVASQQAIQRSANETDWQEQNEVWGDDDYSNEDYGTEHYQADSPNTPPIEQSRSRQQAIQRSADETDWQEQNEVWGDDDYSNEDYRTEHYQADSPNTPPIEQSRSRQQAIQRHSDEADWQEQNEAWGDDDYSNEDYGTEHYQADSPNTPPIEQSRSRQQAIQRHSDETDWQEQNEVWDDEDYSSKDYDFQDFQTDSSSQAASHTPIQRRADDSPTPSNFDKQRHGMGDDAQSDVSSEGSDFPVVQRSMGADGQMHYNLVESDDELSNFDEQDTDVYQAMLDAGLVEPSMPSSEYPESSQQSDVPTSQGFTQQSHSKAPIQRQADTSQTPTNRPQSSDIQQENDTESGYPKVQRQMGSDGQMYYNVADEDADSLPEQPMDIYQALAQAGMITSDNRISSEASSPSDAVQRSPDNDSPLSNIGVPQDIQDAMLQRLREKNEKIREGNIAEHEIPSTSSQSSESSQPQIQRTYAANVQRKPPIPDTIMRDDETSEVASAEGAEEDIDKLARDVYKVLRRRLRDEAERRNRK